MSKWLVQLLCVVTCLVPLSSSFAAPQQKPTRSKSVGADVDKKWKELEDKVEKYRKLRVEASCKVAESLAKTLEARFRNQWSQIRAGSTGLSKHPSSVWESSPNPPICPTQFQEARC